MVTVHTLEIISSHSCASVRHEKQRARQSSSGIHHGAAGDSMVHDSVLPPCFEGKTSHIRGSLARWSAPSKQCHQESLWSAVCCYPPHRDLCSHHFFPDLGSHYPMQLTCSLTNCSLVLAPLLFLLYSAHSSRDSEIQFRHDSSFGITWYQSLEIFALSLFWNPSGASALKTWKTFYCGTFTMLLTFPKFHKGWYQSSFIPIPIPLYCSLFYYNRSEESKLLLLPLHTRKASGNIFSKWAQWAKDGVKLSLHGSPAELEFSA